MKLIFFDIDGTLMDEKTRELPDSAKRAIEMARKNGHLCFVNTGRTDRLVRNWLPKLVEFDGYLMGCGTMLVLENEILLHKTFSQDEALRILEALDRHRIDALLEGAENLYYREPEQMYTQAFQTYVSRFLQKKYGKYEDAIGRFDKFYCYGGSAEHMAEFSEGLEDLVDVIDREHGYFEVVPKGYSKASAMQMLVKQLGVSMADTVAIGDSSNDLAMLRAAGTSIAMGNSTQSVLSMADYVTKSVLEDGIYHALDWLGVLNFSAK